MNVKNVRKVIKALRSGEFKQGTGALRPTKDTMCCLGVGSEVYRRETGLGAWKHESQPECGSEFRGPSTLSGSTGVLVDDVQDWLGFESCCGPDVCGHDGSAGANDAGVTFEQIADEWERLCQEQERADVGDGEPENE